MVLLIIPNPVPKLYFMLNEYFSDFKNAFEKYYNQLKNETTGSMLSKFQDALQSIDSSLINKMASSTFRSDVSGAGVNFPWGISLINRCFPSSVNETTWWDPILLSVINRQLSNGSIRFLFKYSSIKVRRF